jgi:photosystem II stability/assembly factor-like uncharacterized protein
LSIVRQPSRCGRPTEGRSLRPRLRWRPGALRLALVIALWPAAAPAHDPSAWGGLFRTRDGGATWLHVNPGSFVSGAIALAISPVDPDHLLLATDSGVSRSVNGGRDWRIEAPDVLIGPAFAVAFDVDGQAALVSGASMIFRTEGDRWQPIKVPADAAPARGLLSGLVRGRAYLAGQTGLYRTDDWGTSWVSADDGLQAEHVSGLMVRSGRPDEVYAVAGGRLWASADGARSWQLRDAGLPPGGVEVVAADPYGSSRLWAVAAGQVYRSEDQGEHWHAVGVPIPERPVVTRALAASGPAILVATDRGVYRGPDSGERWELPSDNLPAHLEAGLLVLDPQSPATLYAGFALTPYDELRRRATERATALRRLDVASLAGVAAFLGLLVLGAGLALRRLARAYYQAPAGAPPSRRVAGACRSRKVPGKAPP